MKQSHLFEPVDQRLVLDEAIELTAQSLQAYGPTHDHWAVAFSGGKDSTATLTLVVHLIRSGRIAAPKTLTVFYADTRMELLPLWIAAQAILARLSEQGVAVEVVCAPIDDRYMVYILGRGVPPPNNATFRWCTGQIKVEPMQLALERRLAELDGQVLMITGVRQGESAMRDRRIVMSCGKDGAECGQGWYQQVLPEAKGLRSRIATLAPILHWRVCHVWDWLNFYAPDEEYGGWNTRPIADAYGGDDATEIAARTGCVGCPLTDKDMALDIVIANPAWSYLAPLKGLRPIYRRLRKPEYRLRQPGGERRKDGSLSENQQRLGPIVMPARLQALDDILGIQAACNAAASGRPLVDLINAEEEARIRELIALNTWPQKWTGDEPTGDVPLDAHFSDGTVQPLLMGVFN
jgi:DNA sulfur modification protein DndC